MAVHNHPPYEPPCNERLTPAGRLRGACLPDDGDHRRPSPDARARAKCTVVRGPQGMIHPRDVRRGFIVCPQHFPKAYAEHFAKHRAK